MSKLDDLINKLCPDGVEWKTLGEVCETITTGRLNANEMIENGKYAFFTCDKEVFKIDTYAFDCEAILISGNGSQVGHINYYKGKFNAYQRTYVLTDIKNITYGFLLHWLHGYLKPYILRNCKKGSVPYITLPMLQEFEIPVPPLEIQNEIVRILDNFTALTAELTAELTARRKQYEYYRDSLLSTESISREFACKLGKVGNADRHSLLTRDVKVEVKTLGEVCQNTKNIKWKDEKGNYQYIDLTSVDRETHSISETIRINSSNAPSRAQQIVKENDVLFGTTRPMLKRTAFITKDFDNQICSTGYCVLRANMELVNPRYIYHQISTSDFYKYVEAHQQGASYPAISDSDVKKYTIPLPSLDVQQRIVNVLDNFDTICSDLKIGLPAEIEARQKQYEYYRDLLLTFASSGNTIFTEQNRTEQMR